MRIEPSGLPPLKNTVYHPGVSHLGETKILLCLSAWLCFSDPIAVSRSFQKLPSSRPRELIVLQPTTSLRPLLCLFGKWWWVSISCGLRQLYLPISTHTLATSIEDHRNIEYRDWYPLRKLFVGQVCGFVLSPWQKG